METHISIFNWNFVIQLQILNVYIYEYTMFVSERNKFKLYVAVFFFCLIVYFKN